MEQGQGVVLQEQFLQAGALPEEGGGEGRQVVVGEVQQGEGQEAGQGGVGQNC